MKLFLIILLTTIHPVFSVVCTGNDCNCPNGDTIDRNSWCNGIVDCGDGYDEAYAICKFSCNDPANTIIDRILSGYPAQVCDGINDCPNGEDEIECGLEKVKRFICGNGGLITQGQVCDGQIDCFDGLDEFNCEQRCTNTNEIPKTKIFIHGGGYTQTSYELFNPNNMSENHLLITPVPIGRTWHAAAVLGNKVYVIGGHYGWGDVLSSTDYYDITDGSWHSGPVMSEARDYPGVAVINGKIYVCGGKNGAGADAVIVSLCEYLDPEQNKWMPFASPNYARFYPAYTSLGGYLYLIGGATDTGLTKTVERYDPMSNSWTLLEPLAYERIWLRAAPLGNSNRFIVVCDYQAGKNDTCTKYDSETNTWTDVAGTGTTNQNGPLVNLNGEIYVVGGMNGTVRSDEIKVYKAIEDKWVKVGASVKGRYGHIAVAI